MANTTVKMVDRKGEACRMTFNYGTFDEAEFTTNVAVLSYAGTNGYQITEDHDFTTEQDVAVTALLENDADVKASCTFRYLGGIIRLSIPCPKINVEVGLVVRTGENRVYIPATKAVGEVGIDGDTLATRLEGVMGLTAGDLEFASGRITKRA